jgi:hypothetical protein
MHTTRGFVALALGLPLMAWAGDLPVTYNVQDKPLKTSAVAGTQLTFTLYSDPACTQQAYQVTIPIEHVTLISKLKLTTPRNAAKAPTTDQIQATVPSVTAASGNLYLTVTGTGVTPTGAACQPQSAQAAGDMPTIPQVEIRSYGVGNYYIADSSSLLNGNCLVGGDRQAVAVLAGLGTTTPYKCDLQTLTQNGYPIAFLNGCVELFGLSNCVAIAPSCSDGIMNQDESSVDCGGSHCPPCVGGQTCNGNADCYTNSCVSGSCTFCTTAASNCGGPCPACPDNYACTAPTDCVSGHCGVPVGAPGCSSQTAICQPSHCFNGVKDSNEIDVDCGPYGGCDACGPGLACATGCGCASNHCVAGACQPATCSDSIQNQGETSTDCGGPNCPPCQNYYGCLVNSDCSSGHCLASNSYCYANRSLCVPATCSDGIKDNGEMGIDCGGACRNSCATGESCTGQCDCFTGQCSGNPGTCLCVASGHPCQYPSPASCCSGVCNAGVCQ